MEISVNVIGQKLKVTTNLKCFISGSQQFVKFIFNMDDSWDNLTTFAQFRQNDVAYNQYLDANNSVYLPSEIVAGACTLILYGTGGNVRATTNYLTLTIDENILVTNAQGTEITQSLYEQLVNSVTTTTNRLQDRVANVENVIQGLAGGAPIVVANASAMTDTDQIYVLSTDGNWYYHNGTAWVAGGEYGGVAVGSVTTDKLANKSVTTAKLDDSSVTWQKLASGAVHTGELADGAVTTAKIADGAVTANKIASGVIPNTDTTLTQSGMPADAKKTGDAINFAGTNLFSFKNKTAEFVSGSYIPTAAVGSTIDLESRIADSNMSYITFPVEAGGTVYIKGTSKTGSNRRYYNITDENYKVLATGATGSGNRENTLTIAQNGFIVVNFMTGADKVVLYQTSTANYRITELDKAVKDISINTNSFFDVPNAFRYSGVFWKGEYGGFSDATYAMKTNDITFEYDTLIFVPDGFKIATRSNGTRVSHDNYVFVQAGSTLSVAIEYLDTSLVMTEEVARRNLLLTKPISTRHYEETYSSVAIFDKFAVIGDSYSLGSMHWENDGYKGYPQYSWPALMCKRNGNNYTLYSHGGYGIQRWIENILSTVLSDEPKDFYWWGLGINDNEKARNPSLLGSIDDLASGDYLQYPDTLYGMYAKAFEQVRNHAPLAKHVFASCIKENVNVRWTSYKAINALLKDIADHYGVPFIDLVDDPFYTSKFYSDEIRTGHPTLIGYGGMSFANERLLNRCISKNVSYFRGYGRTSNPDDTDPTGVE